MSAKAREWGRFTRLRHVARRRGLKASWRGPISVQPVIFGDPCPSSTSRRRRASRPRHFPLPPAPATCSTSPAFPASTKTAACPTASRRSSGMSSPTSSACWTRPAATFRDLVKVNVLLTRASDVAAMNALYAGAFGPAPYPARTTCVVVALPDPKMLIEIEACGGACARCNLSASAFFLWLPRRRSRSCSRSTPIPRCSASPTTTATA